MNGYLTPGELAALRTRRSNMLAQEWAVETVATVGDGPDDESPANRLRRYLHDHAAGWITDDVLDREWTRYKGSLR